MSSATSGAFSPFLGLTWSNMSLTLLVFFFRENKKKERRVGSEVGVEREKRELLRDC